MKLRKLWIGEYYNLNDLEIAFNQSQPLYGDCSLRFFIGLNGSGKSNALEFLGLIFAHLIVSIPPHIPFEIEYELKENIIRITTRITEVEKELQSSNLERRRLQQIGALVLVRPKESVEWEESHVVNSWASSGDKILPSRIVGYSTGPTSGLQWALSKSIERSVRQRIGDFDSDIQPRSISDTAWAESRLELRALLEEELSSYLDDPKSLFLSGDDALCAVLPLLIYRRKSRESRQYLKKREDLLERLRIDPNDPLPAFSIRVSGNWFQRLTTSKQTLFKAFLRRATRRVPIDTFANGVSTGSDPFDRDFYAIFEMSNALRNQILPRLFPSPLTMFDELLAWKRQGAIQSIRLIVKKNGVDDLILESRLSDGEFLYLGRLAVLLLLRNLSDCLILLDEPDTHFNDNWKANIVNDVSSILDNLNPQGSELSTMRAAAAYPVRNEVLIATHSDLTLTDADPRQVYLFANGKVQDPGISPFAANRGEIARILFGTQGPTGTFSQRLVNSILDHGTQQEIEWMLQRIAGPGYSRFQLRDRLLEIEAVDITDGENDAIT